jgi:1-deoxy-D-xylulose-5-phosphate reductoisomerase
MIKKVVVLGATGSIGGAALEVIASLRDQFRVAGLAAHSNWRPLADAVERFDVPAVAIGDADHVAHLRSRCGDSRSYFIGPEGLVELVESVDADFVLSAIVGAAGLPATLAAVRRGIDVGLANKESLVVAGSLMVPLARETGSQLIPVDSEHSAVFQALKSGRAEDVHKVYLTASGGPFRTWTKARLEAVTLDDALRHPTWDMGPKITIDSATMMNKALEVIEAHHLFGLDVDKIEVLIHPESIVHSMVEFCDGSVIAQLGVPDMKTPIQYALTHPQRTNGLSGRIRWNEVRALNFEAPDFEKFPALRLGFEAARRGGTAGAVLNAANEAAVARFRGGTLSFSQIPVVTEDVLSRHAFVSEPTLDELLAADRWARNEVKACTRC